MNNLCKGCWKSNGLRTTVWLLVATQYFACTAIAIAQEASPLNPHVAPVPNPVSYQVAIVNKKPPLLRILTSEQAKDPRYVKNAGQFNQFYARPVKFWIFRHDDHSMIRTEYENNSTEEFWALGHVLIYHPRTFPVGTAIVSRDTNLQMASYQTVYFAECLWAQAISPDIEESHDGVACYLYTRKSTAGVEKLWIDKHSSLPVARENDDATYSYKFDLSPESIPPLPSDYEKLYRRVFGW